MNNGYSPMKLKAFLLTYAIIAGLICTIWIYSTNDFVAVIIFVAFSFPSVVGGGFGALIGIILVERSANDKLNSKTIAVYWISLGFILGFDVFSAMWSLFSTVVLYTGKFGLEIIPLGLGLLLLASGLVYLILLAIVPATLVALITVHTEKLSDTFEKKTNSKSRIDGRMIVGVIIISLSSCYFVIAITTLVDKYIETKSEYVSSYNEAVWRMLPQPPNETERFVSAFPFEVYVETKSGDIWGCKRASSFDVNCWFPVKQLPQPIDLPCTEFDNRFLSSDELVGKVAIEAGLPANISVSNFINVVYCDFEGRDRSRSEFQYVLTSDGEVWQWGFDNFELSDTPVLNKISRGADEISILLSIIIWIMATLILWKSTRLQ